MLHALTQHQLGVTAGPRRSRRRRPAPRRDRRRFSLRFLLGLIRSRRRSGATLLTGLIPQIRRSTLECWLLPGEYSATVVRVLLDDEKGFVAGTCTLIGAHVTRVHTPPPTFVSWFLYVCFRIVPRRLSSNG